MAIRYYTYAEADKAKKEIQKTDNPEAWLLIESLNIKPI
jgi:hypothetical protein